MLQKSNCEKRIYNNIFPLPFFKSVDINSVRESKIYLSIRQVLVMRCQRGAFIFHLLKTPNARVGGYGKMLNNAVPVNKHQYKEKLNICSAAVLYFRFSRFIVSRGTFPTVGFAAPPVPDIAFMSWRTIHFQLLWPKRSSRRLECFFRVFTRYVRGRTADESCFFRLSSPVAPIYLRCLPAPFDPSGNFRNAQTASK